MRINQYWSHSFLPDLIRPDGIVIDIGAYDGGFSRLVAPICARVLAYEADPSWLSRPTLPSNVQVFPQAIAAKPGRMHFNVNKNLCSSLHFSEDSTRKVEVEAVTLDHALAKESASRIDLIKMDIEGEELAVLGGASPELLSRVVQLTVEFHDFLDPKSVPEIHSVIMRLRGLGFHPIRFSWRSFGDMLFINQKLASLSAWQLAWLRLRYKYASGAMRVLKRSLAKNNKS